MLPPETEVLTEEPESVMEETVADESVEIPPEPTISEEEEIEEISVNGEAISQIASPIPAASATTTNGTGPNSRNTSKGMELGRALPPSTITSNSSRDNVITMEISDEESESDLEEGGRTEKISRKSSKTKGLKEPQKSGTRHR